MNSSNTVQERDGLTDLNGMIALSFKPWQAGSSVAGRDQVRLTSGGDQDQVLASGGCRDQVWLSVASRGQVLTSLAAGDHELSLVAGRWFCLGEKVQ